MGRDAAGVIGIRLARQGDARGVHERGRDPTRTCWSSPRPGYGKRVPLTEFRLKHRGGQGVRLIALEGRKTGLVAAVQQVTETDEELVLISAGGQVIRTDVRSVNRYSSGARGVIVMRLAEGDTVAAIAAFRPGLADRGAIGDNDDPQPDGGGSADEGSERTLLMTAFGAREADVYADQYEIYHGNANPELARKIAHWLGIRARPGRGVRVREREHLRPHPGQRPREGRLPRPAHVAAGQPVDHGAPDHDRRLQAGVRGADHGRGAVLRLRPLGQEGPAAGADHGPPDRGHDLGRRRRPDADDGPPPGPDPGLLQHPGGRAHRRPHAQPLLHRPPAPGGGRGDGPRASRSAPGRSPSCSTRRWPSSRSGATATWTAPRSSTSSATCAAAGRSSSTTRSTRRAP